MGKLKVGTSNYDVGVSRVPNSAHFIPREIDFANYRLPVVLLASLTWHSREDQLDKIKLTACFIDLDTMECARHFITSLISVLRYEVKL